MAKTPVPLTSLSEEQRAEAYARFEIVRPALEDGVSQAQIARTHQLGKSTVQRWIARYREQGLAGLTTTVRKDKGKSRYLPEQAITLVEGLALQTPQRSAAAIHRQVAQIANEQGWKSPSYERVRQIIKGLDPALVTMAIRERQPIVRSLICSIGERRPTPTPCGRQTTLRWMSWCLMKQESPPSPG